MKQIAIIGSVVIDLAVQTPRLPTVGETLLADNFKIGPGGKGANAAVAVQRAGGAAVLVGCIGDDDFGRMEMAALQEEGVDVNAVAVHPEASTGVGIAMIDANGENTILGVLGANDYLTSDDVTRALALHRNTLDGILVNFEVPEPAVAAAVQLGVDYGVPVIVDAGPARPYTPETWRNCTILTPNEQETGTLVGYPVSDDATAERAARELLGMGPNAVVLHRGAHGAPSCDLRRYDPHSEFLSGCGGHNRSRRRFLRRIICRRGGGTIAWRRYSSRQRCRGVGCHPLGNAARHAHPSGSGCVFGASK